MNKLTTIDFPHNLRKLDLNALQKVADELRLSILRSVAKTGGHLASSLGVVELTVALHHVFRAPRDRLVWDVGHQSYAHKMLTGRRSDMSRLRQLGGLAGFPSRDESAYDTFGTGHAGTAISAALGVALGLRGSRDHVVAVVGDGALSAGMAFEGLNHLGTCKELPLTIILNDNGMSISPAIGGLHNYLQGLSGQWRDGMTTGKPHEHNANRSAFSIPTLFEQLGVNYVGPIDGHDLGELVQALRAARSSTSPRLIHVISKKGKGYLPAERDPVSYHGPGPFDLEAGLAARPKGKPTFSQVFGEWVCEAASRDPRVFAITPAMREGSCLADFEKRFPERYIDTAIAEQHAVTLAAGLAAVGMRPVVAIYSTFLQRGYDQVIHDVALQQLPVLFAIDRAGIAGGDGATHLGSFDLAALRCIPHLVLMVPSDEEECYQMLATGLMHPGPSAVRYPRATGERASFAKKHEALPLGKGVVRRASSAAPGRRVALLAFGPLLSVAREVAEALDATVADMRFVKPLDEALVRELAQTHDILVTLEEGTVLGGAGSACAECIAAGGKAVRLLRLGLPDEFIAHGERTQLLSAVGLDAIGVLASILEFAWPSAGTPDSAEINSFK